MKHLDPRAAARAAVAAHPARPATALIHDSEDARLVVFRIAPGQEVAAHTSPSTVTLTVLEGRGSLSGADGARDCGPGEMVTYEPNEVHAMRATGGDDFLLLATITPRPGARPAVRETPAPETVRMEARA